jgi:uncharacterized membrane protein YGL010W
MSARPDALAGPRRVDQLLAHYAQSHRHPANEAIHFVAIPLILVSLLGLLWGVHPAVAGAFVGASLAWYLTLSLPFALAMTVWGVGALTLVWAMGGWRTELSVGLFVGAWILQFVGHRIEGRKPSFLEDLRYLWVGPLFVLGHLFRRLGLAW